MPANQITLGLRSSSGRKRLTLPATASASSLRSAIAQELALQEDFKLKRDLNGKPGDEIKIGSKMATLRTLGVKHGDVLYVVPEVGSRFQPDRSGSQPEAVGGSSSRGRASGAVKVAEDEVDRILGAQSGRIEQGKTPNCQHSSNAQKCIYCAPKEPFDEEYLKAEGIKHMSFQAYLRKLMGGKLFTALEDLSCVIKAGCGSHKPWPEGICSKCQPPAMTLNSQPYRHVDNITFENPSIVDNFLAYWRATGAQRMGFLYGVYEVHLDVPLGVKARVAAIYEPPQECTKDGIKILDDDREGQVAALAGKLGLTRVGWIFTDLVHDSSGYVKHFRNVDSHFLSAQECIMAGIYQSMHPNPCKHASSGTFGSKFGTVLVTGNTEKQVHMEGYQVSNQCMALARDGCLIPTKDAPELGYVRESTSEKYVPDVFYKQKDKYGNEVTKISRPLPVDYLLVDVPVSTPLEPVFTFHVPKSPFPIENRPMEGHLQDFASLAAYRRQFIGPEDLPNLFRDFHLLLYLATQTVNPILDHMDSLLTAVKENRTDAIIAWSKSEHWQTIELLLEAGYN